MTNIISTDLLKQVEELISGASIVKIENDLQLESIVSLGKQVKAVRIETEKQGKANVDPLYKTYKEAQSFVSGKVESLKAVEKNIADVTGTYQNEKQEAARKEQERLIDEARQKQIALADTQNTRIAEEEALREEAAAKLVDADALLVEMDKIKEEAESKKEKSSVPSITEAERIVLLREVDSLRRTYAALQTKRNALIAEYNTTSAVADIAIEEAKQIEIAIAETTPEVVAPVYNPQGLSIKKKLVASVTDYRAALKWLVDNNMFTYLDSAALRGVVSTACNKFAASCNSKADFKITGAICTEEIKGKF